MKKHSLRDMLTGAVAMALVMALISPAGAAVTGKTIEVLTGVEIYVDGIPMNPTDANGNPVETFVYKGTTYVPLRAVSESLGKNVKYDGSAKRVYIGEAPGQKQYLPSTLEPYQSSHYETPATITIAGKKYANVIDLSSNGNFLSYRDCGGWALYNLNGQYTSLSFDMGHVDGTSMSSGTLNIYLDGELSFSVDMEAEDLPQHFTVPLHNALQMKIEMPENGYYAIANVEIY